MTSKLNIRAKLRPANRFVYKFTSEVRSQIDHFLIGTKVANVDVSSFFASPSSDIGEHLAYLAFLLEVTRPRTILELGTRGGESTRVFESYCSRSQIVGRSIDLSAAPEWLKASNHWLHFTGDDILIGNDLVNKERWPNGDSVDKLDFIFVDTSHEYLHTAREIATYVPLLSQHGIIAFHDSNLTDKPTRRLSGKVNYGWDNDRGVARAIEEYFRITIPDGTLSFARSAEGGWSAYHMPWNNGLTLLTKNQSDIF